MTDEPRFASDAELRWWCDQAVTAEDRAWRASVLARIAAAERERDEILANTDDVRVRAAQRLLRLATRALTELRAEKAKLVKINAALRDRPDLGDRARRVQELIDENAALRQRIEEQSDG